MTGGFSVDHPAMPCESRVDPVSPQRLLAQSGLAVVKGDTVSVSSVPGKAPELLRYSKRPVLVAVGDVKLTNLDTCKALFPSTAIVGSILAQLRDSTPNFRHVESSHTWPHPD